MKEKLRIFTLLFLSLKIAHACGAEPTFQLSLIEKTIMLPAEHSVGVATLVFRIKNSGDPLTFTFYDTWRPIVTELEGRELPLGGLHDDSRPLTNEDFPRISHGQATTTAINFELGYHKDHYFFRCDDGYGGEYFFDPIHVGRYKIRLRYTQRTPLRNMLAQTFFLNPMRQPEVLWQGSITTKPVYLTVADKQNR